MRAIILIILLSTVYLSTATIDVEALTKTAKTKLQSLADQASTTIQGLTDNIDLDKVKQLDFLNIIPRIHDRLNHHQHGPSHLDKIKFYLEKAKSLTGSDLIIAFDAGIPWPAFKKMDDHVKYI